MEGCRVLHSNERANAQLTDKQAISWQTRDHSQCPRATRTGAGQGVRASPLAAGAGLAHREARPNRGVAHLTIP